MSKHPHRPRLSLGALLTKGIRVHTKRGHFKDENGTAITHNESDDDKYDDDEFDELDEIDHKAWQIGYGLAGACVIGGGLFVLWNAIQRQRRAKKIGTAQHGSISDEEDLDEDEFVFIPSGMGNKRYDPHTWSEQFNRWRKSKNEQKRAAAQEGAATTAVQKKAEEDAAAASQRKAAEEAAAAAASQRNAEEEAARIAALQKINKDAARIADAALRLAEIETQKEADAKRKKDEEEAAAKRRADEEAAAKQKKEEEEAAQRDAERKAQEADAKRRAEEEEARRDAEKKAQEAAAKLKAEEEAARRDAEKKAQEAAAKLKAEEEAKQKKEAAEKAARIDAEKAAEEAAAKLREVKEDEEERLKVAEEETRMNALRQASEALRLEAERLRQIAETANENIKEFKKSSPAANTRGGQQRPRNKMDAISIRNQANSAAAQAEQRYKSSVENGERAQQEIMTRRKGFQEKRQQLRKEMQVDVFADLILNTYAKACLKVLAAAQYKTDRMRTKLTLVNQIAAIYLEMDKSKRPSGSMLPAFLGMRTATPPIHQLQYELRDERDKLAYQTASNDQLEADYQAALLEMKQCETQHSAQQIDSPTLAEALKQMKKQIIQKLDRIVSDEWEVSAAIFKIFETEKSNVEDPQQNMEEERKQYALDQFSIAKRENEVAVDKCRYTKEELEILDPSFVDSDT